jgi:hypothetical protein
MGGQMTGKVLEGSGGDLIYILSWQVLGETDENHEQERESALWPTLETGTISSFTSCHNLFGANISSYSIFNSI